MTTGVMVIKCKHCEEQIMNIVNETTFCVCKSCSIEDSGPRMEANGDFIVMISPDISPPNGRVYHGPEMFNRK